MSHVALIIPISHKRERKRESRNKEQYIMSSAETDCRVGVSAAL